MSLTKAGQFADLTAELAPLTAYYNENFDRLAMINFLPFYCSDVNALIHTLMHFEGFTAENKESFILPLIEIMKAENIFYEPYRLRLHEQAASSRTTLEDYLSTELTKYSKLFAYWKKEHAIIGISYSMTCNGRGFGNPQAPSFSAIVPLQKIKRITKLPSFKFCTNTPTSLRMHSCSKISAWMTAAIFCPSRW